MEEEKQKSENVNPNVIKWNKYQESITAYLLYKHAKNIFIPSARTLTRKK